MAMDLQTTMERFRELYQEKNDHMQQFLEPVTPFDFYREIFPVGSFERKGHFEDSKGNGIAVTVPQKNRGQRNWCCFGDRGRRSSKAALNYR